MRTMRFTWSLALLGLLVLFPESATAQGSGIQFPDPATIAVLEIQSRGPAPSDVSEIIDGWRYRSPLLAGASVEHVGPRPIAPRLQQWPLSWQWTGALIGFVAGLMVASETADSSKAADGCIGCGLEWVVFPVAGAGIGAFVGHVAWIGSGRS